MSSWLGFFAPAGTPRPVVTRLNTELVKILNSDTVKERLASLGLAVAAGTPEALAEKIGRAQSELQSRRDLVCRLLLEKKKKRKKKKKKNKKKNNKNKNTKQYNKTHTKQETQ